MLKIPLAEQLLSTGQKDAAHKLLDELQSLSWSPVFYPEMNEYLVSLKQR